MKKISLMVLLISTVCFDIALAFPFLGVNSALGGIFRAVGEVVAFPASLVAVPRPVDIELIRAQSKEWTEQQEWNMKHPNSNTNMSAQYCYSFEDTFLDPKITMENQIARLNSLDDERTQKFTEQKHNQTMHRTLWMALGVSGVLGFCKYNHMDSLVFQGVKYSTVPATLLGAYFLNNIITCAQRVVQFNQYDNKKRIYERDKKKIFKDLGIIMPLVDSSAVENYNLQRSTVENIRKESELKQALLEAQARQANEAADSHIVLKDAHQKFLNVAGGVTNQLSDLNSSILTLGLTVNRNSAKSDQIQKSIDEFKNHWLQKQLCSNRNPSILVVEK